PAGTTRPLGCQCACSVETSPRVPSSQPCIWANMARSVVLRASALVSVSDIVVAVIVAPCSRPLLVTPTWITRLTAHCFYVDHARPDHPLYWACWSAQPWPATESRAPY